MKTVLLALLLSTIAMAELQRRDVPAPPGLPSYPAAVVQRLDSPEVLFHGYSQGETGYLDIYTATDVAWKRQAHLEVSEDWAQGYFAVSYLNRKEKKGWVLWSENNGVTTLIFPDGWGGGRLWGGCDGGNFTTTGWSTAGVDESGDSFSFYERHEWPGEETENGRQVESSTTTYTWSDAQRAFVSDGE